MATTTKIHEEIIQQLFDIEAIRFGDFKLKSGIQSPIYFNLRVIIGYPTLLREISELLFQTSKDAGAEFDLVCGVPYTALPIATCMSLDHNVPMVIRRREAKDYGTRQMIEGEYKSNDTCLIVEDVVTTGGSVLETMNELANVNVIVKDAVVLLDRGQGGTAMLKENGVTLHSALHIEEVLNVLLKLGKIVDSIYDQVCHFIKTNQFQVTAKPTKNPHNNGIRAMLSYKERMQLVTNPIAKRVFEVMEKKETNLCFSVDVTTCAEVLHLANTVGPYICILKTHVDILKDFTEEFVAALAMLSVKHDFLVFEDRKFADIGNTVKYQYSKGIYEINRWADITNAHAVPGDGVIDGLREAAIPGKNACLLLAQMSSSGALTNKEYTQATVNMAEKAGDFVIGFISTSAVTNDPKYLHMTPGINIDCGGDSLGQVYLTPEEVIKNRKCDVIIVGRGIYKADDPAEAAKIYKDAGYNAYREALLH